MAKKNIVKILLVLGVLAGLLFPGFSKYQKISGECRQMKLKIETLERKNAELEREKYKLETDIEYVEKRAREKLGIVKKDEIPYKIKKEE